MPVIINELEVVTESQGARQPAPAGTAPGTANAPPPPPSLGREELDELLRHDAERSARLSAV